MRMPALVVLSVSLGCAISGSRALEEERSKVAEATIPPGTILRGSSALSVPGPIRRATWSLPITVSWKDYATRARANLAGAGYTDRQEDGPRFVMGRRLDGDFYLVAVEHDEHGIVHVTFSAQNF
jgi:hypothetical protein